MFSTVPTNQINLMFQVYRKIFPQVRKELDYWTTRAMQIPDKELKKQALASIHSKRFHCQGGAVFALLAGKQWKEAVRFIVAYQTISDYLDNLCDRSTSLDPMDFQMLHESMKHALLTSNKEVKNYYLYRNEQKDKGYLQELVRTCQQVMKNIKDVEYARPYILTYQKLYADMQVHKHVHVADRVPRLTSWHKQNQDLAPDLTWYEFAAAAGSTLGIFNFISYGLGDNIGKESTNYLWKGYFPYVQALHILLDYYIDQKEDRREGDLNFCSFYPDEITMLKRFLYIIGNAEEHLISMPNARFHEMVIQGLVGLYLGDRKANSLPKSKKMKNVLLAYSGSGASFFNLNTKIYYAIKRRKQGE